MPLGGIGIIIAILLAAGVILVAGFLTVSLIRQKLRERHSNLLKAKIKKKEAQFGIQVVHVDVKDIYGRTIAEEKFASLDGCSSSIRPGDELYC